MAMLWGFQLMILRHAPDAFSGEIEDMSYAWYVPLFSLYVVWRERREIARSIGEPSLVGLLVALPAFAAGFLGIRGHQLRLEIVGFAGLLIALTWTFFGRRTMRRILFPALFLLFCMPLSTYLDVVTVHLRLFATNFAYIVLKGVGVDVIRRGTMIASATGSFAIDVADPCSGLRSLFALMALTAGYAYFNHRTWLKRGVLFALSVPIAVLGNVARILSIVVVAAFCSPDFATGFYHDYSGYVVFMVAIGLMLAASGLLSRIGSAHATTQESGASDCADATDGCGSRQRFVPVAATVLTCAAMWYQALTPEPVVAEAPEVALVDIAGFSYRELEPGEAELTILPSDTRFIKRLYESDDGRWFQVTVVIGGASKSSIHRPELCLPTQGFQMVEPRNMCVGGIDWHVIKLDRRDAEALGFAYTFFNQTGFRTASHMRRIFQDVWDRSVLNRIDRWVMITVNSSSADDGELSAFLEKIGDSSPCLRQ